MAKRLIVFLTFLLLYVSSALADTPGERRYNYVSRKYEFFDGASWFNFDLGQALGGCPKEGEWEYNTLLQLYQYCNGTNWIRIIGLPSLSLCSTPAQMDYASGTYWYCNGLVWVNMKGSLVI